ncbi:MAG TPA: hypothetical protein VGG76_13160, partial [Gemmatimonadaceae bacterium]
MTRSDVGSTRVTLSERGTKDSRLERTRLSTMDVNPRVSLIRQSSTSPAARKVRENQFHSGINRRLLSPGPKRFGLRTSVADSTEAMTPWPEVTIDDG